MRLAFTMGWIVLLWIGSFGVYAADMGGELAKITDPNVRKIIEEIHAKTAHIQEYTCTIERTVGTKGQSIKDVREICYRRPNLFFEKNTNIDYPIHLHHKGQVEWRISNGREVWHHTQHAPGSDQYLPQAWKNLDESSLQKKMAKWRTPQCSWYDLAKIKQAGVDPQKFSQWPYGRLIQPFTRCDMATLKLVVEDDQVWFFSAQPRYPSPGLKSSLHLKINKSDGLLQKFEERADIPAGKWQSVETISKIQINPTPPIPDQLFTYTMPPGTELTDHTDPTIKRMINK